MRSAAEERLAQRMWPHRTSPVISSMLADNPTSLNGWSLPEKSWKAFTTRLHSEHAKRCVACAGSRVAAVSSAVAPGKGVTSSRLHTASACMRRVCLPRSYASICDCRLHMRANTMSVAASVALSPITSASASWIVRLTEVDDVDALPCPPAAGVMPSRAHACDTVRSDALLVSMTSFCTRSKTSSGRSEHSRKAGLFWCSAACWTASRRAARWPCWCAKIQKGT